MVNAEHVMLRRYRAFVALTVCAGLDAGTIADLLASVDDGTVNLDAVHYMMAGFPYESFTAPPSHDPDGEPLPSSFGDDTLDAAMRSGEF